MKDTGDGVSIGAKTTAVVVVLCRFSMGRFRCARGWREEMKLVFVLYDKSRDALKIRA